LYFLVFIYSYIIATRCHILRLKCTEFDFSLGSAPVIAHSAPPDTLVGFRAQISEGREGMGRVGTLGTKGEKGKKKGRQEKGKGREMGRKLRRIIFRPPSYWYVRITV